MLFYSPQPCSAGVLPSFGERQGKRWKSFMYSDFCRPVFYAPGGKVRRRGSFCPVFGDQPEKFVLNSRSRPEPGSCRRGLKPLHATMQKNRASWSEGDQKARGIFEFSTPVGLGDFRLLLYNTYNRNAAGKQRTIFNQLCPEILTVLIHHQRNHKSPLMSIDYFQNLLFNKNPEKCTFFQIPVYTRSMVVNIPLAHDAVHEKD
jgi:hypothetical protein